MHSFELHQFQVFDEMKASEFSSSLSFSLLLFFAHAYFSLVQNPINYIALDRLNLSSTQCGLTCLAVGFERAASKRIIRSLSS